ncbi:alpha/beta fold hydrolase [Sphingomonas sp. KR3-1]|uniref:alpha/beta hydrolase family protein n=1 Tax=Sphingomonas sp. KR3-1 TaxID=3156611 RepID=UPI0032B5C498
MRSKWFGPAALAVAAIGAGVSASAWAQTAPAPGPVPAAAPAPKGPVHYETTVFAELPAIESPSLSPKGDKIAARIAVHGVQYFGIYPLDGSKPVIIGLGESDLNWWRWVNADWLVVGIGQTVPVEDEEWYITRSFGVRADGTKMVKLNKDTAGQNASDLLWVARDGSPRILLGSQNSIYSNEQAFWPRADEIDVTTGKTRLVQPGLADVWNWYADGNGVVRMGYGMSDDGRKRRLYYRKQRGEPFKVIDRATSIDESIEMPTLFKSDPNQALIIDDDAEGYSALYEYDLTKLERGKQLFAAKGFDIGDVWSDPTGFGYLGIEVNRDKPGTAWTDPAMTALQAKLDGMIKGGQPEIVSMNDDHSAVIVHVGAASAPGAYFLYRAADESMTAIGNINATIGLKLLHRVKTIRYKARDGLEIAAVMTLPSGEARNAPLIVMPHGGPYARDTEEWDWWAQFLADRGYVVIQPNYRGSSGYGTKFTRKGQGQWGLAMQDDLDDAVTELAKQGIADPKRVCMVGASYGGYAAMRAAQRDGSKYRCAVAYAGVSDLNRMLRFNSNFLGSGARQDWLRRQVGDLKGVSPLNFPEQFSTPILIVHGKKDRTVPVSQSRLLAKRLKDAGKNATYIEQPEGDHHFSREADRLEFLKALEAFLAKYNPA